MKQPESAPADTGEVDIHNLTHLPPREWCVTCKLGRSRAGDHSKVIEQEVEPPRMQFDYTFMNVDGTMDNLSDGRPTNAWSTTLVGVDQGTQSPLAISLPHKAGPSKDFLVTSSCDFIRRMAYHRVRVRVDQEPALIDVIQTVKDVMLKEHSIFVDIEFAPRYSSHSLGAVGACQRALHEQIRTMRVDLDSRYGTSSSPSQVIWPWLVRHAAWLLERFRIRANKRTSYEDNYGLRYRSELLVFGETALFRYSFSHQGKAAKKRTFAKGDTRFEKGIFVGKHIDSNEWIFATREGIVFSRTVKRLPKEQQFDGKLLAEIVGTPWGPKAEAPRGRPPLVPVFAPPGLSLPTEKTAEEKPQPDTGTAEAEAPHTPLLQPAEADFAMEPDAGDSAMTFGSPGVDRRTQQMKRKGDQWEAVVSEETESKRQAVAQEDEDVIVSSIGGLTVLEEDDGFEFDAYEDGDFGDFVGD